MEDKNKELSSTLFVGGNFYFEKISSFFRGTVIILLDIYIQKFYNLKVRRDYYILKGGIFLKKDGVSIIALIITIIVIILLAAIIIYMSSDTVHNANFMLKLS